MASAARDRFLASMQIGYDEWHDGVPYDLATLAEMTAAERGEIEALLLRRTDRHWRDIEALQTLATPAAIGALRGELRNADPGTRLWAARALRALGEKPDIDEEIVAALEGCGFGEGFAPALSTAAEAPSDAIKRALLRGALLAQDDRGIHFAALLYFIHGKTDCEFDWDRRPFFLRFGPGDPDDRRKAFAELCAELEIPPTLRQGL